MGYTTVLAIPRDMEIAGFKTRHTNTLRLWDAKSPVPVDMSYYSRGEYLKAVEQQAMAEVIAKVLYPDDNHYEGKSLRLKQQYFFVFRHRPVHRAPAPGPVRHPAELP